MAAVRTVEPAADLAPGVSLTSHRPIPRPHVALDHRGDRVSAHALDLSIIDGPMRGTVVYRIEPHGEGPLVTIRNVGHALGFPRWLLTWAMRRPLTADLRRLKGAVEGRT